MLRETRTRFWSSCNDQCECDLSICVSLVQHKTFIFLPMETEIAVEVVAETETYSPIQAVFGACSLTPLKHT